MHSYVSIAGRKYIQTKIKLGQERHEGKKEAAVAGEEKKEGV
jgi:hypothetical protein